jgi:hypothetical protein
LRRRDGHFGENRRGNFLAAFERADPERGIARAAVVDPKESTHEGAGRREM